MTEMRASDSGMLACSCGLTFATADELDEHFYDVFVPPDDTGSTGSVTLRSILRDLRQSRATRDVPDGGPDALRPAWYDE